MTRPVLRGGRNYAEGMGIINPPKRASWDPSQRFGSLGNIPSAIGGIKDRQLLPQTVGFIRGRAIKSKVPSKAIPIDHDDWSARGLGTVSGQITKAPIFPVLDRPKPLIDFLKFRDLKVERVRIFGQFGLMGQVKNRNIPVPQSLTRTRIPIPKGTTIANFPSAIGIKSGPSRTGMLAPQSNRPGSHIFTQVRRKFFGKQYPMRRQSNLPGSHRNKSIPVVR